MEEILELLKKEASTWSGVKVAYRESWDCDYFQVADKGFCMLGKNKEEKLVMTIKGLPETNEELREQFSFIVPGYYSNKTHWISILLEESDLEISELVNLLKRSYTLVFEKLPKKVQKEISNERI